MGVIALLSKTGLIGSNSDGRRLITGGGLQIDGEKVTDFAKVITADDFKEGKMLIKKGKKVYHQISLV